MDIASKKKGDNKNKTKKGNDEKSKASDGEMPLSTEGSFAPEEEIGSPSIEADPLRPQASPPERAGGQQKEATTVPGPPAEEIFVDGVSGLFFRSGVVKMDCYRVVGHNQDENKEVRMSTHRIVLPVSALQELVQLLQNASNVQRSQAASAKQKETD